MTIMAIKQLSETLINQIAAGEVIEKTVQRHEGTCRKRHRRGRYADRDRHGGRRQGLVRITDNGSGMSPADLELAVRRHCTSKISTTLDDIRTLGFRGEALPSIGSVAKLTITSRQQGQNRVR